MEESMRLREENIQSLKAQNRALGSLLKNKSEKIKVDSGKTADTSESGESIKAPEAVETAKIDEIFEKPKAKPPYNPKDRGNNNAKRKEYFDLETVMVIEPAAVSEPVELSLSLRSLSLSFSFAPWKELTVFGVIFLLLLYERKELTDTWE